MKVFIVGGAGIVGSATAFYLSTHGIADEIVLQDLNDNMVCSHAMDLSQAVFLDSKTSIRSGTWADATGADVVVIAAGLPAMQATHDARKDILSMRPLIRSIAEGVNRYCPNAVVLSMTNPLDGFNYVLYREAHLPAKQFIAMSVNDSLRMRWSLAEHLGISADRVDGYVVGEHNPSKICLFSTITVDGKSITFSEEEQNQILKEISTWWNKFLEVSGPRTAAWTTGSSCGLTIEHLIGKKQTPICCSTILEDGLSIGWPVYLSPSGVQSIESLKLAVSEQLKFDQAKKVAKSAIAQVLEYWDQNP